MWPFHTVNLVLIVTMMTNVNWRRQTSPHCYRDNKRHQTSSIPACPNTIIRQNKKKLQEECIFESLGLRAIGLFKIRSCWTNELFDKFCPRGHFFWLLGFWNNRLLERWEVLDSISLDHSLITVVSQIVVYSTEAPFTFVFLSVSYTDK